MFDVEGWNSWYGFRCVYNETVIRQTADAIVASGLAAAGYEYGLFFLFDFVHAIYYFCMIMYSKFG